MERLTARDGKSAYFPHCFKMCEGFPHGCEKCHFVEEICECLAAYEDSGLAPEQITELTRRATPDGYMEGVKYAIYEIFKEADIPGSQEIRDSGDTDDGMCARAAKRIRAELPAGALQFKYYGEWKAYARKPEGDNDVH